MKKRKTQPHTQTEDQGYLGYQDVNVLKSFDYSVNENSESSSSMGEIQNEIFHDWE